MASTSRTPPRSLFVDSSDRFRLDVTLAELSKYLPEHIITPDEIAQLDATLVTKPTPLPSTAPKRTHHPLQVPTAFIGNASPNSIRSLRYPSHYHLGKDTVLTQGASWRWGGNRNSELNVFGASLPSTDDSNALSTVLVYGVQRADLLSRVTKTALPYEPIPTHEQTRSDWIAPDLTTWDRLETTRSHLASMDYLYAVAVFVVSPLLAVVPRDDAAEDQDGSTVTVRVHNTLGADLRGLEPQLHYEGGRGKPMPKFEDGQSFALPPGESMFLYPLRVPAGGVDGASTGHKPKVKAMRRGRRAGGLRSVLLRGSVQRARVEARVRVPYDY